MAGRKLVDPREETKHRRVELGSDDEDKFENENEREGEGEIEEWSDDDSRKPQPPVEEAGLSVDPEDLGIQWLNTATEQGNFESSSKPPDDGMHIERIKPKRTS